MTEFMLMALGIIVTMLGYFLTRLSTDIKSLETSLVSCQTDLPKSFVLKSDYKDDQHQLKIDFKDDIAEIKQLIGKLFDRVDGNVNGKQ